MRRLTGFVFLLLIVPAWPVAECAAEMRRVEHPFILWTKDDVARMSRSYEAEQPVTIEDNGQSFTFAGHAYMRVGARTVEATGDLRKMKIRVPGGSRPQLTLNGKAVSATSSDGFLAYEK